MPAINSCRSVSAVELIWGITRSARRPSSTILQRRSRGGIAASDPVFAFEPVQQGHYTRLFHAESRGDLSLGERVSRERQMHQRAPFRLTQSHRLKPLVQFLSPCTGRAMEQQAESFSGFATGHNSSRQN